MQVWHFSDGLAQSIPDADGSFRSDKAYVVLAPPTDGEGQQRLYLWAGNDAPQDAKSTAAKHASELKETLGAAYLRQAQGQESAEFKQLFASFAVVEAAADPAAEAVPPQVGAAPGDGEEGDEGDEHDEGEDEAGVSSPTATGGKKKKRRSKKKGGQGGSGQAEVGVAAAGSPKGAAAAAAPAASSPRQPNSPPAARPNTPPVTASPLTSPRAAVMSPRTSQLHVDAPPFTPRSMRALAASASPFGMPEPPSPAARQSASRSAALSSPTAPKSASPSAAQPSPTTAAAKPQPSPAAPAAAAASPAAAAPSAAPAATSPKSASPKLSVAVSGPESVAKAKQQIMGKLSGSLTDPLGKKQQQAANGAAGGKAGTTFLAESAKAWGGVSGGEAAPAPPAGDVKVKPGEKTFGYEELKALRVESGIDMTCKEAYLSDAEFEKVFGKDRAAFEALPAWRKQMAKKDKGLF